MNQKLPSSVKPFSVIILFLLIVLSINPTAPRKLSVIVQSQDAIRAEMLVEKWGGQVTSRLDIINGVGALIPEGNITGLSTDPELVKISINAETLLTGHTFERAPANVPVTDFPDLTGADIAWQEGATGNGIGVAVIDTGIALHPSLMKDMYGKPRSPLIGWVDFVDGRKRPTDPNGHGTHIAGIIANASTGSDGEFNGMAPGANLVGVRVLDQNGSGTYEQVIQGIQWTIANKAKYNIKVINLSLYSLVQSPYWADPLNQAVMRAWAEGITVVVAIGNTGPNPMTVAVPGNTPYVITAGAFTDNFTPSNWDDDYLTPFSSAGPTLDGFTKPDLLAPGAHVTSTMMPGSSIARNHNASWVDGLYFSMAGTSQAAAVVSGAAAQVAAHNDDLSPDQIKYRLMVTALPWISIDQTDVVYSVWQQGAGRLNAYDAIFAEDIQGAANSGMDLLEDLEGSQHFEGYSYFDDASDSFFLRGFEALDGGYSSWSGGYGSWSGGYGSWSGGYGSWSGGYGSWSGGYGSWSGDFGVWAGQLTDPIFITNFMNGISPNIQAAHSVIGWVPEK